MTMRALFDGEDIETDEQAPTGDELTADEGTW